MNRCPPGKFANFLHDFDILEGWIGLFSHYLFKNAINLPKNKMHYAMNQILLSGKELIYRLFTHSQALGEGIHCEGADAPIGNGFETFA